MSTNLRHKCISRRQLYMQSAALLYNCRAELLWGNSAVPLINIILKIRQNTNYQDAMWTFRMLIKQSGTEPSFRIVHNTLTQHCWCNQGSKFNRQDAWNWRKRIHQFDKICSLARNHRCNVHATQRNCTTTICDCFKGKEWMGKNAVA